MATTDENAGPQDAKNTDAPEGVANPAADVSKPASMSADPADTSNANMEFILDIPLEVSVELGRTKMLINDLLKLGQGSVIELAKVAGETLEILANQKLIARGEVVVVNEKYGVRLTEIISPIERIERLQ